MRSALLQLRFIHVCKYWRILATRSSFLLNLWRSKELQRLSRTPAPEYFLLLLQRETKHPDRVAQEIYKLFPYAGRCEHTVWVQFKPTNDEVNCIV